MKRVRSFWTAAKKYWAIIKINFVNMVTYKVDLFMGLLFQFFILAVLFFLYRKALIVQPAGNIERLSLAQTMWIIFFSQLFSDGGGAKGVSHTLNDDIISGQIAYQLNRPYSFMLFHFAQHLGAKLPLILVSGLVGGLYVYFVAGAPAWSLSTIILGGVMFCIGIVMSFLMLFCIGLCAFWIGIIDPLRWIFSQMMIVAGGGAVPIAFFPSIIKKILMFLPFSNVLYGGARIMVGPFDKYGKIDKT